MEREPDHGSASSWNSVLRKEETISKVPFDGKTPNPDSRHRSTRFHGRTERPFSFRPMENHSVVETPNSAGADRKEDGASPRDYFQSTSHLLERFRFYRRSSQPSRGPEVASSRFSWVRGTVEGRTSLVEARSCFIGFGTEAQLPRPCYSPVYLSSRRNLRAGCPYNRFLVNFDFPLSQHRFATALRFRSLFLRCRESPLPPPGELKSPKKHRPPSQTANFYPRSIYSEKDVALGNVNRETR